MENTKFYQTDCDALLSQIKHHEKDIQLKRRWLLGLPTSKHGRKKFETHKFLQNGSLPESFLREDDIFYETVKSYVLEAFGHAGRSYPVVQDNLGLSDMPRTSRVILSCLDDLTNKGLYLLATVLTEGQVRYPTHHAATRQVLDGLEDLPFQTLMAMHRKLRGRQQITPRLQPHKSGWNREPLIKRVRKTGEKMLAELGIGDKLQDPLAKAMAVADLSAKLTPGFHNSSTMEFHEFSPKIKILQNEITKAIWLVSTKVGTPELRKLQFVLDPNSKISIRSLRTSIKKMLIEYLFECSDMVTIPKSLLEAVAIINKDSRRTPDDSFLKDEIEEEVECILSVSAHTKQVFWDLLPDQNFDLDFTDAYMEDLQDSDDDDDDDDGSELHEDRISQNSSHSLESNDQVESTGDYVPCDTAMTVDDSHVEGLKPNLSSEVDSLNVRDTKKEVNDNFLPRSIDQLDPTDATHLFPFKLSFMEPKGFNGNKTSNSNQYLAIQDVCDETSMIAYNLIGHMLEKFAWTQGLDLDWTENFYLRHKFPDEEDSQVARDEQTRHKENDGLVTIRLIKELMPFLPDSGIERLKKLMDL
ncbi:hypothetical protein FEM48_Zijuj11G0037300 [Ziziphus jujuba var. spinosa]|uniref:Uncharacterized protein n=1 Tax=Ziziphus jujuba var. spinosa TaxID=714518 RepID=A0A978UGM0_ZIZJJ|nr:hypothetical protein FEM48_Zijuj11G0037300 [Ziziphus jujuba var. spinosa]